MTAALLIAATVGLLYWFGIRDGGTTNAVSGNNRGSVQVLVANATGQAGSAGAGGAAVTAAGFDLVGAVSALGEVREESAVFFQPGFEADAAAVAGVVGLPATPAPIDATVPVEDLLDAEVVAVIGLDQRAPAQATSDAGGTGRPPGEVSVVVANASGVPGAAGQNAAILSASGFSIAATVNATGLENDSTVHFAAGFEADAAAIASALGIDLVLELDGSVLVEDTLGADVVATIGADLVD